MSVPLREEGAHKRIRLDSKTDSYTLWYMEWAIRMKGSWKDQFEIRDDSAMGNGSGCSFRQMQLRQRTASEMLDERIEDDSKTYRKEKRMLYSYSVE